MHSSVGKLQEKEIRQDRENAGPAASQKQRRGGERPAEELEEPRDALRGARASEQKFAKRFLIAPKNLQPRLRPKTIGRLSKFSSIANSI